MTALAAGPAGWLAAPPPGPGIGRQAAQRLARTELARPQYHHTNLWQLVLDFLNRLLGEASVPGLPRGWGALVLLAALGVALAASVLLWNRSFARSRRLAPAAVLAGSARSARDHYLAAQRLAQAGDYGEASLECVRAIAADLQERQVLPARPGRTADEFAAEAGQALPAEAAELRAAAATFDAICYGKRPGSPSGYRQLAGLADRIGAGTGRGRGPVSRATVSREPGLLARGRR